MINRVITGQQIGLLGGPIYTAYKVLGAVHYSHMINGNAIYWLETNDADFNEINHINYIDKDNNLQTLKWNIDSRGFSVGYIPVDDLLIEILNRFFDSIRQTKHTCALRELALSCYKKGRSLGEASLITANALYGRSGLELFEPSDDKFLKSIRYILIKEAEQTPAG